MQPLCTRKHLVLFVMIVLLSAVFGTFSLTPGQSAALLRHGGYYVMLVMAALWSYAMVPVARRAYQARWSAEDRWLGLVVAFAVVISLVNTPFGFKVLNDEMVLMNGSMLMHFERQTFIPDAMQQVFGMDVYFVNAVDKRPMLFPFILSVVHDLSGYRVANVFVLNGILTVALYSISALLGRLIFGMFGGVLAVVLLAGTPLVAANATGGGFEILNLVLILLSMFLAIDYMRHGDDERLSAYIMTTILLANTRYESVLFVVPAGVLVVWTWVRDRSIRLTWAAYAAPLVLSFYLVQNKMFRATADLWQLSADKHAFGGEYVVGNIGHAVAFFFDPSGKFGNPMLLSIIGIPALVIFLLVMIRSFRSRSERRDFDLVFVSYLLVVFVCFALLMFYHWGQLDDYVVARLALPLIGMMCLAVVRVLADIAPRARVWKAAVCTAVGGVVLWSIPVAAKAEGYRNNLGVRATGFMESFVKEHGTGDTLYITNLPLVPIIHRRSAMPIPYAVLRAEALRFQMKQGTYRDVYVFQLCMFDVKSRTWQPQRKDKTYDVFEMDKVVEYPVDQVTQVRVSRLREINAKDALADAPAGMDTIDEFTSFFKGNIP